MMNERSLSDYAGLEAQPKVVPILPGSEPFRNLWFNFDAKKMALLPGTELEDPPQEERQRFIFDC